MKFWGLIIAADLSLARMWLDEKEAVELIAKGNKIYNAAHYQEAIIVDGQLLWKAVLEVPL